MERLSQPNSDSYNWRSKPERDILQFFKELRMSTYKVVEKKGKTVFESDSLEACLKFCRSNSPPLKVYRDAKLLAYKSGSTPKEPKESYTRNED